MDITVENLCQLLVRSKLRSPESVKSVHQRWRTESKDTDNVNSFARWLVTKQVVTEYQAALLLKGRDDGFFLNQYQIVDRLGMGRMAGVYKAVHTSGQVVAIKILPPSRAKQPEMLARFKREAQLAMKLKHPNVVRSFQTGKAKGLNFLVMENLEGETLDDALQRRKTLGVNEAVRLVHQAFMGLQHIHEMNMVHRDLKPANLMLVPAPGKGEPDSTLRATIKILDIGLGREFFDENEKEKNSDLTAEGTILGTPDYLAPEQARDSRAVDIRADVYSLGCVLYHLLTGQPPFPDKNLLSQMVRHATETPKPLQSFNPAIPEGLQQIMNVLLAKKPDQRYPTPEKAAQALQAFLKGETAPARRDEAPSMKKYLTWLESTPESEEGVDVTPVPPTALPAAMPVAVAGKVPVATFAPKAVPAASPAAPADALDVELVGQSQGLSQRDWILIGTGGAVLLVLIILILVIAFR